MKIKASLIVSGVSVLKAMDTMEMKLSTAYKVKTILAACQTAIEDFEVKRIAMAESHGTLSEDKTHYKFVAKGSQEAFQKEMQEMLDDVIDINIINKIHVDLLDEYLTIEPTNVNLVSWFVEGLE